MCIAVPPKQIKAENLPRSRHEWLIMFAMTGHERLCMPLQAACSNNAMVLASLFQCVSVDQLWVAYKVWNCFFILFLIAVWPPWMTRSCTAYLGQLHVLSSG